MDQAEQLRKLMQQTEPTEKKPQARVITVTSGKGGVGKTNLSLNLAVQLVRRGKKVVVFDAIANMAKTGLEADMNFICDPNGALLVYATDTPSIEEPSAGYIFTWDMLGDGNYMPILQWPGDNGTHSEFIEGLIAQDMRITANELGCYFADCV